MNKVNNRHLLPPPAQILGKSQNTPSATSSNGPRAEMPSDLLSRTSHGRSKDPTFAVPTFKRKPETIKPRDHILVFGLEGDRSSFTPEELDTKCKTLAREGKPLVLLQYGRAGAAAGRFHYAPSHLRDNRKTFSTNSAASAAFITLYFGSLKDAVGPVHFAPIARGHLLEAFSQVSEGHPLELEEYTQRVLVAAVVHTGILGQDASQIGVSLRDSIPASYSQDAISGALLRCRGELGSSIAQTLFAWGADPNVCDPDDEVSALCQAVMFGDEAMIRSLVQHGADIHLESETTPSAVELVQQARYAHMAPLVLSLAGKAASST